MFSAGEKEQQQPQQQYIHTIQKARLEHPEIRANQPRLNILPFSPCFSASLEENNPSFTSFRIDYSAAKV